MNYIRNLTTYLVLLVASLLLVCAASPPSDTPPMDWVISWESPDFENGKLLLLSDLALDYSGGAVVAGWFLGDVALDPGACSTTWSSGDDACAFVAGVSPEGEVKRVNSWRWPRQGSASADAIAVADEGSYYIAGCAEHVDFSDWPEPDAQIGAQPCVYGYLAKFDPNLNRLWSKPWGSADRWMSVCDLAWDGVTGLYMAGQFRGTLNCGGYEQAHGFASVKLEDAFLARFNESGDLEWVQSCDESSGTDRIGEIAVDSTGNLYAAGDSGHELFLRKYSTGGELEWMRTWRFVSDFARAEGVAVDPSDCVCLTGSFCGFWDRSPADGDKRPRAFLLKLDADGQLLWHRTWGGQGYVGGNQVVVNNQGNSLVIGYFAGNADFDPGPETAVRNTPFTLSSWVPDDRLSLLFVSEFSPAGSFLAVLTGPEFSTVDKAALDSDGSLYIMRSDGLRNLLQRLWLDTTQPE